MSDNTKVTIIVDGLGKQEINLSSKDATAIYVAASQGIIDKLITKDKPEHSCSCGGSCQSQSVEDSGRGKKEDIDEVALSSEGSTLLVGYTDKGPINTPVNLNETGQSIREFMENPNVNSEPVMGCRINPKKSNIDLEEVDNSEDINEFFNRPYPFTHEMFNKPLLVAYRCPHCGKITVRYLTLGESNEARCHWCKENAIIEKVVQSEIKCPGCDTKNHPYLANGLAELECVKCKAPIDVIYYKDGKKDRAKSANLID